MSDYATKVYLEQGGNRLVVTSGGSIDIEAGGSFTLSGTAITATAAEINKLSGATASTAELNKLTGVTASTAEINKLTGATASTTELNKLTGVTATAAEINTVAGVAAGAASASKALVVDANKDLSGLRHLTITGTLTAATIVLSALPAADPHVIGALYSDAGTVKASAG